MSRAAKLSSRGLKRETDAKAERASLDVERRELVDRVAGRDADARHFVRNWLDDRGRLPLLYNVREIFRRARLRGARRTIASLA